jgi:hypothetical protein
MPKFLRLCPSFKTELHSCFERAMKLACRVRRILYLPTPITRASRLLRHGQRARKCAD